MLDYSFFALLFLVATSLAPPDARTVVLENTRHAEQRLEWTRGDDGRWAMTINGRDMGHFARRGSEVVHETGLRDPDHFAIEGLVEASDLRPDTTRLRLRGQFAPSVLRAERNGGALRLASEAGSLIPVPLRLLSTP